MPLRTMGSERLINQLKVTQLVNDGTEISDLKNEELVRMVINSK